MGAKRRLRAPCARARPGRPRAPSPPFPAPRLLLLSLSSPPLLRPAPLPPAPRPPNPARPSPLPRALSAGPGEDSVPAAAAAPPPGARRLPDLSDSGLSGGSVLAAGGEPSRAQQTLAAAPDAGGAGARTFWVRAERAPGAQRRPLTPGRAGRPRRRPQPAELDWTERIPDCAEPGGCRAWAEGIPAPSDPSDFGSRAGTGPASPWSPCARVTCGLGATSPPDPRWFPTRSTAGVGGDFSCPLPWSAEAPPPPTVQMSRVAALRTSLRPGAEGSRERSPP